MAPTAGHGRMLAVGVGAYRNAPEQVLAQIERVREPAHGKRADGVSLYSYRVFPPNSGSCSKHLNRRKARI